MKKIFFLFLLSLSLMLPASAQTYTSYFTGSTADVSTNTSFGICLMGGGTEHDEAMRWFLNNSVGGDIVVIRVTGADGYNNYLYSGLGVNVNSVETIIIPSIAAANDPYVEQQLANAEAIWIAGGDQWNYLSYWKNTKVDSILNLHVNVKQAPVGGTSAGMAVLGQFSFSAENGTVSSAAALSNPYDQNVTLDNGFFYTSILENVITDTHYDNPDRKGRHVTFMARMANDFGVRPFGIACDEYTAVCIDSAGIAHVYGDHPSYDDNAYFLQIDCVTPSLPEVIAPNTPLTWQKNNDAVRVYAIKGDMNGTKWFDLNDWRTGSGGAWEHWYVVSGQLNTGPGQQPNCFVSTEELNLDEVNVYPNPSAGTINLRGTNADECSVKIFRINGSLAYENRNLNEDDRIDISNFANGIYFLEISIQERVTIKKLVISK